MKIDITRIIEIPHACKGSKGEAYLTAKFVSQRDSLNVFLPTCRWCLEFITHGVEKRHPLRHVVKKFIILIQFQVSSFIGK